MRYDIIYTLSIYLFIYLPLIICSINYLSRISMKFLYNEQQVSNRHHRLTKCPVLEMNFLC